MASLQVLVQIGGAVALLLFGLSLVSRGVSEAFGTRLRMALGAGTRTGLRAFLSGLLVTLGVQSSTATAMLAASFADRGIIGGARAQIVLLGANVGTALTAVAISVGFEALAPLFLLSAALVKRRTGPVSSGLAQALTGLGLMLIALTLIRIGAEPLRGSEAVAAFLALLDSAWPVALLVTAALAALCASSLAAVMLVASLDLPSGLSLVMVLGANLGGALMPALASRALSAAARRLTMGNLALRALGALALLPFAGIAAEGMIPHLPADLSLPVAAHLAFNIGLAIAAAPFCGALHRCISLLLPEAPRAEGRDLPDWLNEAGLGDPAIALAAASRQAMGVGDDVARMLELTQTAFQAGDPGLLPEVARLEDRVDRAQQAVKLYLSRLGSPTNERERLRQFEILDYVINLEHVGDIIEQNLLPAVRKKISSGLHFSDKGQAELERMFSLTSETLQLAQSLFLSRDLGLARRMMAQKLEVRAFERRSAQRHLQRLRDGDPRSRDTSSLHLDILRDLKRISSHLVSVSHPILDAEGLLGESRLRDHAAVL